jgi:hypothetical protein
MLDESLHGWFQQTFGCSVKEDCDYWGQVGSLVDSLTDEARELMDVIG